MDAERKVVTPVGMQDNIYKIVAEYSKGRSFVRPSGTEDCMGVYSEADTRKGSQQAMNFIYKTTKTRENRNLIVMLLLFYTFILSDLCLPIIQIFI